jgi:hypothetical protein
MVLAVLMEDSASIKKTEEEKREDEEIERAVNATLAAKEEKKKRDEEDKKKRAEEKKEKEDVSAGDEEKRDKRGEVCRPCGPCPGQKPCEPCPKVESGPEERPCPPCEECPEFKPCPSDDCPTPKECPEPKEKHCPEERPCLPCRPCGPCPRANHTEPGLPDIHPCPQADGMPTWVAMAVGAIASLVVTGVATAISLLLRYVPPTVSGFLFLTIILVIWYLCSQNPAAAREMGGRVVEVLRQATTTLSHRILL